METTIALVKNDKVENIIVATFDFASSIWDGEVVDVSGTNVGVNWQRVNGVFEPPAESE